jgi:hypothetical protein
VRYGVTSKLLPTFVLGEAGFTSTVPPVCPSTNTFPELSDFIIEGKTPKPPPAKPFNTIACVCVYGHAFTEEE